MRKLGLASFLVTAILLALGAAAPAVAQQGRDTGVGFCPLHKISYRAASCPSCASRSTTGGTPGADLGSLLGAAFTELLRGDPNRTARLEAEAQARALAYYQASIEASRKKHEAYTRLLGQMKLDNFDGDGGPKLKGVGGAEPEPGGGPALKLGGDDGLRPKPTAAAPNEGDPMVVDLRDYRRAAYAASQPGATPDAIAAAALGEVDLRVPTGAVPEPSGDGMKAFQEANQAFRRSHHDGQKEAEYFQRAQAQREIVGREMRAMKADLERQLAAETDPAARARLERRLETVFATARAEDAAWENAKAELAARTTREQADRARVLDTVNALRTRAPLPKPPERLELEGTDLRTAEQMKTLAANMGWSDAERKRLNEALHRQAVTSTADRADIQQVWRDVTTDGRGKELAALTGPVVPAAGTQTEPMDCTVHALANAAGLPYGVVSSRAGILIRQADWRPEGERLIPQDTIAKKGLIAGEVVMLAESFGQADIVPKGDFAPALAGGRTLLVNVVGSSGDKKSGHQVVLTRSFQHQGTTWYEMIESSQGPLQRLYLSDRELKMVVKEDGVAFTPDPRTVPALLREPDKK